MKQNLPRAELFGSSQCQEIFRDGKHGRYGFFGLWLLVLVAMSAGAAAPPSLGELLPRGGQRGTTVDVTFHGGALEGAREVLFHGTGISASDIVPVEGGAQAAAKLIIAPDCPTGLQAMRIRTLGGVSNLRLFSVGSVPETQEVEPNDTREAPQAVPLNWRSTAWSPLKTSTIFPLS